MQKDDLKEINKVTDHAIEQGYDSSNQDWKKMALECVKQVALREQRFTMNDVRWMVDASPIKTHDKRAMGGVIKTAQKLGWVALTGESIPSKVGHRVPIQIWKSKIYKPKDTLF